MAVKNWQTIPMIGLVAADGYIESYSWQDAEKNDFHHQFTLSEKGLKYYNEDDRTLRFTYTPNQKGYMLSGQPAADPFHRGRRQIELFARHVVNHGAEPNTLIIISPMFLKVPFENNAIGIIGQWAMFRNSNPRDEILTSNQMAFLKELRAMGTYQKYGIDSWNITIDNIELQFYPTDRRGISGLELTIENTGTRGEGNASRVMDKVVQLAAKHRVKIFGYIDPFGDSQMNITRLRDWYRRHGFRIKGIHKRLIEYPNPQGGYGLRQYIFLEDGSTLYIARIHIELHAIKDSAILEYLDRLLKLPGANVKVERERDLWLEDKDGGRLYPIRNLQINIDADSQRYTVTDDQINQILEDIDISRLHTSSGKVTLMGYATAEGKVWRGNNYTFGVTITSRSMGHLTDYMYKTFPKLHEYSPGERYYRDGKVRPVNVDFGLELFLDGPDPKWTGNQFFGFGQGLGR